MADKTHPSIKHHLIQITSQHHLCEYKFRQKNPIPMTPDLILGKYENQIQQIWIQQYQKANVKNIRSIQQDRKFQIAIRMVRTVQILVERYGRFSINQNMVFQTIRTKDLFIWINTDLFANIGKIFLPNTTQGQISMLKALINYFKLWLNTHYIVLIDVKNLQELIVKLEGLKKEKPPTLINDFSCHGFSVKSCKDSVKEVRLYQSSKIVGLRKIKKSSYSNQNSKKSDTSSITQKSGNVKSLSYKGIKALKVPIGRIPMRNPSFISSPSILSPQSSPSYPYCFNKQSSQSFHHLKPLTQSKFPNKTTSSTLNILNKIKEEDINNQYKGNNLVIQGLGGINIQGLGGINQELDCLFMSNVESQQDQRQKDQREREFQRLLDI